MPKGPLWDARVDPAIKVRSLIATRSLHEHARRRKRWNRGFSTAAVKGYEPIVSRRALQLVEELKRRSESLDGGDKRQSVDLAKWLSFFTCAYPFLLEPVKIETNFLPYDRFDFMGDMAFGGGFELMRDGGDREGIWKLMEDALEIVPLELVFGFKALISNRISAVIQHVPWLAGILYQLPGVTNNINRIRDFGADKAKRRKENGTVVRDLFYHIVRFSCISCSYSES